MNKKKTTTRKIPLSELQKDLFKEKTIHDPLEEGNPSIHTLKSINSHLLETRSLMQNQVDQMKEISVHLGKIRL